MRAFGRYLSISFCLLCLLASAFADPSGGKLFLRENWLIQSSNDVHANGRAMSTAGFSTNGWYPATLPSTVLSALVEDKVYPSPYVGMNLRSIPGTTYPIFEDFSTIMMPPGSPFRQPWWYRTEFKLPPEYKGKTLWLGFDGINYKANVWMNGVQIVDSEQLAGTWRVFRFDVTKAARPEEINTLAIEVFPPEPRDLAITLVDWAPMPPDKEMGVWRDVYITATGPLAIRFPAVLSKLNVPSTNEAELTVRTEISNATDEPVDATVKGRIGDISFEQPVHLGPKDTQVVRFAPEKFSQLKVSNPRLWWPAQVGKQELYPLDLVVEAQGGISDSAHIQFGIRQATSKLDDKGHRLFQINGKNILIRGGGYSFDMMLRSSPERQEAELEYVRNLNLNAVRLEGKIENDHFFDLADQMGILVLPGWCCCDQWENWPAWDKESEHIAGDSLRDQLRRLERHPSVITWLYGSDFAPPPRIENMYLQIMRDVDWPNPSISSAGARTTTVGPSGVKMTGPYEYVAPLFWYVDTRHGGAFGFNTETSPGPAIPPIESLRRMLPPDHLWPIDSVWEYHAGGMSHTLGVFTEALDKRYGKSKSVEEFAMKSQVQAYETHRAMMEAYGRNKYRSTGIIQWMLNNAWPSMIWHLYDWYLRPGGSYYGVKHACEPLHVQYSYDDHSIVVVNSYYQPFTNLKVAAKVYNLDMTEKFSNEVEASVRPDSSTRIFSLPQIPGLTQSYFVNLTLEAAGKIQSRNFYWLSTHPDTLDWSREEKDESGQYDISTWTPTKDFANYTDLNTLPRINLEAEAQSNKSNEEATTVVTLHNPTSSLAFAVRLKVDHPSSHRVSREGQADNEILPVLWEDNYLSLLPGETRQVTARYRSNGESKLPPVVEVEGWNVNHILAKPQNDQK